MKDFSLVREVLREAQQQKIGVRSLGPTEVIHTEGELSATEFETRVEAMRVWCRSVEKLLVAKGFPDLRVHAGFERMSRIVPVLPRYRALARKAQSLVTYGLPDYDPAVPGLQVVPLASGPLVNEWFLVAKATGFGAVIVADDLDGFGGGIRLGDRRFRGLVSHHPALVSTAMDALDRFSATRVARS